MDVEPFFSCISRIPRNTRCLDFDLGTSGALQVLFWSVVWVDGQVGWKCILVFKIVGSSGGPVNEENFLDRHLEEQRSSVRVSISSSDMSIDFQIFRYDRIT